MKRLLHVVLLLCLLCGCSSVEIPEPEMVPEPEPVVVVVEEPVEAPEPAVTYPVGIPVIVEGAPLQSGSILVEDAVYVKLEELAAALDTVAVWNDTEGGILWRGRWVELRSDVPGFRFGRHWTELPTAPFLYEDAAYVPVEALCQGLEIGMLKDEETAQLYVTAAAGVWEIPAGYCVPIIMYHGVTDDLWGMSELFVRPADLDAQLQYLVDNGYTPIWFEDLARVDEIEKPVILTFDDGYADNYHELYPLLQKHQVKATIFVVTGTMDYNPRSMTSAQIAEVSQSGLVSIQSHTVTHPYLSQLSAEEQQWELEQSRLAVTRITGQIPYVICYPSGDYDATTLELARSCYRMGIDMNGGDYWTGDDPYEVSRWYFARSHSLEAFIYMINANKS